MKAIQKFVLNQTPLMLQLFLLAYFGAQSTHFLEPRNLANIVVQASSTGIVAIGMTFVLLVGGVDLSVGAVMFVAAALAGKLILSGLPLWLAIVTMLSVGAVVGLLNAWIIVRFKVVAFIVTLSLLFVGRGLGLYITETRAMNLPDSVLMVGTLRLAGVPFPAWLFAGLLLSGHFVHTQTAYGRQLMAFGHSPSKAKKAGLNVEWLQGSVYVVCGVCAAIAALVSLGQLGGISPKFGEGKEFAAIAAAVLGGTSLFGGKGSLFPGTFFGVLLIQTIENGMVIMNTDPYLYPMVTSGLIFLAVGIDALRCAKRVEV